MQHAHADIHIRPARLEDAPAIADLAGQLGYPTTAESMHDRLAQLAAPPLPQAVLVAVQSLGTGPGAVRGWVQVWIQPPIVSNPHEAEIVGLVVDATCRNHGVGRALVRAAESWAAGHAATAIRVRSNIVRTDTHRFYARCGYRTIKTQINFQKELAS